MKGFYGFWHRILAGPFRILFNIKVEGKENEPSPESGAFLVCSNHISAGDAVWLCASLRRQQPHFMAKAELFKIPLLSGLIRLLGAYPVERGSADIASLRTTVNLLKDGKCVGMFPQGTRHKGKNPLETPVKSGAGIIAVRGEVQVLPVFIQTKNFRSTLFGRKKIIIGKPIPYDKIAEMHAAKLEYNKISGYIFDQICKLGELGTYVEHRNDK